MMDPGVTELGKEVMTFMARPPLPMTMPRDLHELHFVQHVAYVLEEERISR